MQQSNLEPFLKTDTTFAVLSIDGKEPEEKEKLNKLASCLEMSVWNAERTTRFTDVERRYDIGYFVTICRLDKYIIIALMFEVFREVFMRIIFKFIVSATEQFHKG